MLSKTRKSSPIRIAAGVAGMGALSLVALGLTASGSQAAERIRSNVEAATGIALSGQDAPPPPSAQDAPPPPSAPTVVVVPAAAPGAPGAPQVERRVIRIRTPDGQQTADGNGRQVHRVIVTGDHPGVPNEAEIEAMIPDIQSRHCGNGEGGNANVVDLPPANGQGQRRMVICINRIEAQAEAGRHHGIQGALGGLRGARAQIQADTTLTAAQKAEALKGIDQAIRELQSEAN